MHDKGRQRINSSPKNLIYIVQLKVDLGKSVGLEVNEKDVQELIYDHNKKLTTVILLIYYFLLINA